MSYDQQKQQELEEARKTDERKKSLQTPKKYGAGSETERLANDAKNLANDAKNLAKNTSPAGFFSLILKINIFTDWMYGLALMAAILKDISDFAFIGSFPLIGAVITFLVSIFIGFMMLLGSIINQKGKKHYKVIRAYLILGGGTIAEAFLFGLNFIPIETLSVLFVWALLLSARKQAAEEQRRSGRLAEAY